VPLAADKGGNKNPLYSSFCLYFAYRGWNFKELLRNKLRFT
jgi:hypothetical protein